MENAEETENKPRRRRRRRRRKGPRTDGAPNGASKGGMRRDLSGPPVNLPPTGHAPNRRMAVHPKRGRPSSSTARRRRFTRTELDHLGSYLGDLPE